MKKISIVLILSLMCGGAVSGIPFSPFSDWRTVEKHSTDIIIARCLKTVDNPHSNPRGLIYSDIQVVSVLKGRTNLGLARLGSVYWPRQGENYLIFARYMDGTHDAVEEYRVVPLGTYVPRDLLTGKTLDENIKICFRRRLENLEQQMKEEQEEKQRLEDGLKQ
jgi:hypothetical protein